MIRTGTNSSPPMEIAILGRILSHYQDSLTPEMAHYLLELGFNEEDKARMHALALKNQEGALSSEEKAELLGFANAGCVLGILQSKARRSLKKQRKTSTK